MQEIDWGTRLEYLEKSRVFLWNADYFSFLVERVWRIEKPVKVADFGCGLGFAGRMLLPLLPQGSSYTGIDKSSLLLDEARKQFECAGLNAEFLEADITTALMEPRYDIAVCHALLQHFNDPCKIMETMKNSVRDGGLMIFLETDRNLANAGLFFEGLNYHGLNTLGTLQKLWENDRARGNGDPVIGMKLPAYMRSIGLKNIGVRCSDYIQLINPQDETEKHQKNVQGFLDSGWANIAPDDKGFVKSLMRRGLTRKEAERQRYAEEAIVNYLHAHSLDSCIAAFSGIVIGYGYK